ncbi:hypothetical protein [Clostridium ljungdahlii]|uniref:Uncharacterized protein n=1 Tax=Clostridium ljungdahlii TaxID=1538 RepID=A0A162J675_9CLOT|nr:hypothetical protein [Clostridium ljungdahlii]OAA90885.1 hypothetical protein WY13_00951 [Clostridium ljungdahlii]
MGEIGFRYEEEEEIIEVGQATIEEVEAPELNSELIRAINILVSVLQQYNGVIKGINIETTANSEYSAKLKY